MGEAVQHLFPFTDPLHRQTIVLLVQEKSGLLPIDHVHHIMDAVFHDLYIRIKRLSDKILDLRKPFLFSLVRIAALINPANMDSVCCQHFF